MLSFTRAAESLNLTQPGISKHIKELEECYGTRLFDRLGKKVVLTQAGEVLFQATGAMFEILAQSGNRIRDLKNLQYGVLKIGASMTIGTYLLPNLLATFKTAYPCVEIVTDISHSHLIEKQVLNNSLEIGIVGHQPENRSLSTTLFRKDILLLVVSNKHPWALRKKPVSLVELSDQTFLLSREGSGTRDNILSFLAGSHITLHHAMEFGTTEGVKRAVEANLGISILSRHVVAKELASKTLRKISMEGPPLVRTFYLIHHRDRYLSAAARSFIKIADKRYA